MDPIVLVLLVIVFALLFDFTNGWNDSANSIATIVSTRVLRPGPALVYAATLNFAGAFASTAIAKMVGTGIVDMEVFGDPFHLQPVLLAAMLAAAGWVGWCSVRGLPISASHSLIGALVGAAIAAKGPAAVHASGLATVVVALFLSPLLGLVLGYALLVAVLWAGRGLTYRGGQRLFGVLQVVSSGFMSYEHGQNDAQKVMGVIAISLFAGGLLTDANGTVITDPRQLYVPTWVVLACGTVIALGTGVGGWRVIRTLGSKLAHLTPVEGFAVETAAGAVLEMAALSGVPVSTTHTITGAILGVGSVVSPKRVRWMLGAKIVYAWLFTFPATFGVAWVVSLLVQSFAE
ncbi:MAG TPA: inorganic phosphate transporter [Candidatus Limnocylindria bacterium]|nr:inorganic phosphate transporter [Candidatus Limnocylindria bacterium]